ncbi:hypothetical protein [Rhizobium sp. S163]|uniref:hypothetical protein n=1 Tax=Rhizobium sp. S163 TaxID=3055039 RepID=UPI000DDED13C|nr:hypothetical protein [Rhizobium sp. S163]MDM9646732.1 hypothetical protein [Rhizobium sp. S163]
MSGIVEFSKMSIKQREAYLETLANRLHVSASIAQHDGEELWMLLDELADQLDLNLFAIAEDYSASANAVVEKATLLLAKFEWDIPSDTLH